MVIVTNSPVFGCLIAASANFIGTGDQQFLEVLLDYIPQC